MTKQQQTALQKGRERAAKAKRKASIQRVLDYKRWLSRDSKYGHDARRLRSEGNTDAQVRKLLGARPRMPAIPSDYDFHVARDAGKIT
jgi:hypothetical protein